MILPFCTITEPYGGFPAAFPGVEVALDIEQLAYEASRLLDAASLLNRISQSSA
jgi:hypothetical protein